MGDNVKRRIGETDGPAVQGRRGRWFFLFTWGGVKAMMDGNVNDGEEVRQEELMVTASLGFGGREGGGQAGLAICLRHGGSDGRS